MEALEHYQRVEAVIAAFAAGEIVVVSDDDDRENEGDLFVAASLCTPEKMAFIIRNTSGIVCAPLSAEHARRLHLDPMVAANDAPAQHAAPVAVPLPATEPSPPANAAFVGEDENEALVIDASSSKRSKRAPKARPARPAPAVTSAAPPAPKRRAAVDDSEPDVGY